MIRAMCVSVGFVLGSSPVDGQEKQTANPSLERIANVKEPELAKELVRRFNVDQEARKELMQFEAENKLAGTIVPGKLGPKVAQEFQAKVSKVEEVDRNNLKWIKAVVAKHGWPGKSLVGTVGAQNAWLLVQHADRDRDFQESCLRKMESMPKGEVDPQNLAYLTDRILVGRGKKQRYGTQGMFKDGKVIPSPIEDEATVDQRRKAIGLEPLADYLKVLNSMYQNGKSKADPKRP